MRYDTQDLIEIFYSGDQAFRVDQQDISNIKYLIDQGLLIAIKKRLAPKQQYLDQIEKVQKNRADYYDFEGGGIGHMALKVMAKSYLINKGLSANDIQSEVEFMGYRPDLMTKNHKLLVECGNTETGKVFSYFQDENVEELIIIPYPSADEETIMSYDFKPGEDLNEFLHFFEKEK